MGSHAFIVSGGMGISVDLSLRCKRYVEEKVLPGIEAMIPAAGAFLNGQLGETFKASRRPTGEHGELERIYFLLGGYSFRSAERPYQLALWGSETLHRPAAPGVERSYAWVGGRLYGRLDEPGPTEQRRDGHGVVDAGAGVHLGPRVELDLVGRNLLDESYRVSPDSRATLAPGRAAVLTVTVKL